MNQIFRIFAAKMTEIVGSTWAFLAAVLTVITWAVTGPYFRHSKYVAVGDQYRDFVSRHLHHGLPDSNQHSQNRDMRATHLKLGELIGRSRKHGPNWRTWKICRRGNATDQGAASSTFPGSRSPMKSPTLVTAP